MGECSVGEGEDRDDIVLTVPGEPDFVSLVRIAARLVAGRAGQDADARTQLQAAVGRAFFAITEGGRPDGSVSARLSVGPDQVAIELQVDSADAPSVAARLVEFGIDHELSADGRTLRARVARQL